LAWALGAASLAAAGSIGVSLGATSIRRKVDQRSELRRTLEARQEEIRATEERILRQQQRLEQERQRFERERAAAKQREHEVAAREERLSREESARRERLEALKVRLDVLKEVAMHGHLDEIYIDVERLIQNLDPEAGKSAHDATLPDSPEDGRDSPA
jgi:chromosome segregation ATPase